MLLSNCVFACKESIQLFIEWKNRQNWKPLIVRNVRQVGKTYAIIESAKEQIRYIHREGNTKSVIIYDNLIAIFVLFFK